eukprot:gene2133-47835_t
MRRHARRRPYCDGFKPVLLHHAMSRAEEGAVVAWADASQYDVHVHVPPPTAALGALPLFR